MPIEAASESLQLELRTRLWEPTAADIECASWLQAELRRAFETGITGPEPVSRSMYVSSRREFWKPTRSPDFSRVMAGVIAVLSDEFLLARAAESTLEALAELAQEVAVCQPPPPVPVPWWKRITAAGLSRLRRGPKADDR
ncbi:MULTISPECIES: hypothetical protein [Streptomyces]|uniref:Uncharacterized protein n=1 Tax=Streptomyces kaniharaensis TaxID=212423 RepID=A0A6N7L5L9_9ACTN|nr:hypothetical protein [Streptomyces kaniharaensis]MQS17303.1 hypothetical protein [Streptomyces kaniharaensis]